ncbi:MAG: deoxyguanosinetriphosphate triphosphohydrolase [Peptoniphilaceae bacterium]|nr:deoxyguanosinetriphosphate triphosphohydrolase [Peptoniphilaceae bacterium]
MLRERTEALEDALLSPYAAHVRRSRGRAVVEPEDPIRTAYQRDRDRILHAKCFRRLKHKTQVFIAPEGDHYRTRLTHTLEVSQVARTMARALRLNEDLIEAMAMGHDVGHTPFGHAGEHILQEISPGFHHAKQSVRTLTRLEMRRDKQSPGLNLTWEVLDGVEHHSGTAKAATLEGRLLKYADRIAYVNHDIDDSLRAGVLHIEDLPQSTLEILGRGHSERITTLVNAVIEASDGKDDIAMSEPVASAFDELRRFMFAHVYTNELVKGENAKLGHVITDLYDYLVKKPHVMPADHRALYEHTDEEDDIPRQVLDYIAGMTDDFLIRVYRDLFIPKAWSIF